MTQLPAIMMTVTIAVTVVMVPRHYLSMLTAARLYQEEKRELLRELLALQNGRVKRHVACGFAGLVLIWMLKQFPHLEIPLALAESVGVYVLASLFFAFLDSLLAQKIEVLMASIPVRVKVNH